MKTGAELKARREELKITQHDLAGNAGISRTQLSRMENGKIEIPSEIMEILCDLLYAKHEKQKLQFSDLEVGDYVYVRDDLVEHQGYGCNSYVSEIGNGIQQIKSFHSEYSQFRTNKSDYWVTPEMLDLSRSMKKEDYLKMNEKEDMSFDDLVDSAKKGVEDNTLIEFRYTRKASNKELVVILSSFDGKGVMFGRENIKDGIKFIQSLYIEEFVIETMADELNIKSGADVTLSNGMKCIYFDDGERKLRHDGDYYPCNFLVLKGATVRQSKGSK